jgi:chitinase
VTDDEETSCQSNCKQPGSGGSDSNVQKRIIGYYEAWNYEKRCIDMPMDDIPVTSLTHIYYSFAYIRPETYEIIPMSDEKDGTLTADTFRKFTALKKKNPAVKAVVALGGWTFNDNHTIRQPVFSDLVSTEAKRNTFIQNLIRFMQRYGFDGVDLDWEYPGAEDRGGHSNDGVNLTKLVREMRVAFSLASIINVVTGSTSAYEISFTAPTSYWVSFPSTTDYLLSPFAAVRILQKLTALPIYQYLRHFDLAATVEYVDYVNVMAYDLHGIWDRENPIGSQVLPHTNLTEIDLAMDLLWRNDVPASKVNLGLGFYGRAFELADPACAVPGCLFKGGAAKGPCTGNSGTLSYREIMEIINKYNIKPTYDKESGVKWISWNTNQWVSYDDQDTIQQKIKYANDLGLGGLLIWVIDLDNSQLDALAGVLHPRRLGSLGDVAEDSAN